MRVICGDNIFFCFSLGATLGYGLYAGTGYTCENTVFPSGDFVNASAHLDALTALHKVGKQSSTTHRTENKNNAQFPSGC